MIAGMAAYNYDDTTTPRGMGASNYTTTTTTTTLAVPNDPAGEVLEPPAQETATWTPVRERNQRRGTTRQRPAELPSSYG